MVLVNYLCPKKKLSHQILLSCLAQILLIKSEWPHVSSGLMLYVQKDLLNWVQISTESHLSLPHFVHIATAIAILCDSFIIDCGGERLLKFVTLSGKTDESDGLNARIQTEKDLK